MMFKKLQLLIIFLFLVMPTAVFAQTIFDYIPAADCAPTDHNSISKLELRDGVWAYKSNKKGHANLECSIDSFGDHAPLNIGYVIGVFQDFNGADDDGNATFRLLSRDIGGVTSYGSYVTDQAGTSDQTVGYFNNDVPIGSSDFWFVRIDLYRDADDSDEQVAIWGLFITD